jgi:acyl transferase domain-containing protein
MSRQDKEVESGGGHGERPDDADIAIIGMSCRFPGADGPDAFWDNLINGRVNIREVPSDRWDWRDYYGDPREPNRMLYKWGGFIDGVDLFDGDFFRVSPAEARLMDPQQRLMLQLTWTCLEDAGYLPASLAGSATGVYAGAATLEYRELIGARQHVVEAHRSTGNYLSLVANRVSYFLDLRGPSLPFDTACSSSLFALHYACQALKHGEINLAVAGGVNAVVSPLTTIAFAKTGMLSPSGMCRTFDASADGYVRGEGGGVVLLKRLRDALRDGDRIHGVIKGSAVNHGGKAQTLTSPNPYAQSQVIHEAYVRAGISVDQVSYIEAHGTGTPKGDPLEITGLKRAWRQLERTFSKRAAPHSCGIGAVKTNIGHTESAAGMAGVIKLLMAFRHRQLPALANFEQLNPQIHLDESPFYLVTEPRAWEPSERDGVLTAGVSAFGFAGTNAHVVLQSPPGDHQRMG